MNKQILIIGSLNMDLVVEINTMPLVGETILGSSLNYIPGGKGANQACAAGKLGGQVTMLGCVGTDNFGDIQISGLTCYGVDMSEIRRSQDLPTGTAIIYVDKKGNNSIVVVQGANKACDMTYLKEHDNLFLQSDYVVLQMEIQHEAVYYAINRAKKLGKTIVLNPAPAPDRIPDEIWGMIDYFTPNETELMKLSGRPCFSMEEIEAAAHVLLQRGVANILVTLGKRGALLVNTQGSRLFSTEDVAPAVDTTAAGDCFNAAFVVGLAENMAVSDAVDFANLASAISVTRKGAQRSLPLRSEVDALRAKVLKKV